MSILTRNKAEEAKKEQEQRRVILTLCSRYLQSAGYTDIAQKLIHDSGLNLDKFDVADNIDLPIILKDFEDYYILRHNKPPKLLKKPEFVEEKKITKPVNKAKPVQSNKKDPPEAKKSEELELSGKSITKPKEPEVESHDEFYENRLLKPLPDYPAEYKDLALSIHRDICMANPGVYFKDIVGLTEAKRLLKEAVLMPMKYPHLFTGLLEPWKGILLFGPPGTGKTMLAKAVATECRTTFFNISASTIVSKWRGDSEKLVRVLFELAKYYEPSTIFIDEIDSILSQRDAGEHEGSRRMKTELLIQMDGLVKNKEKIFLLAASNLPWDLDMALLRRLEKRILVPLPSREARKSMIESVIPQNRMTGIDTSALAGRMEGYSGSDIKLLCKEASMKPLRRLMKQLENMDENITMNWHVPADPASIPSPGTIGVNDFEEALNSTKPASSVKQDAYEEWFKQYGSV